MKNRKKNTRVSYFNQLCIQILQMFSKILQHYQKNQEPSSEVNQQKSLIQNEEREKKRNQVLQN